MGSDRLKSIGIRPAPYAHHSLSIANLWRNKHGWEEILGPVDEARSEDVIDRR